MLVLAFSAPRKSRLLNVISLKTAVCKSMANAFAGSIQQRVRAIPSFLAWTKPSVNDGAPFAREFLVFVCDCTPMLYKSAVKEEVIDRDNPRS
jgi:hypothetical protein